MCPEINAINSIYTCLQLLYVIGCLQYAPAGAFPLIWAAYENIRCPYSYGGVIVVHTVFAICTNTYIGVQLL